MLDAQRHRGPDDRGTGVYGNTAIGQVRLSIVDLSPAGHQPLLIDGGRLAVVFNGEIFNYIEIRRELESGGVSFFSGSDTEVLLRAYDRWGTDAFPRLNGMWAFAIYDRERRRLVCSRDRFGVKPFSYALVGGEFLFGSEVKALLAAAPTLAEPDDAYIARFLRTSISDDGEETFFRDVKQLLPGHYMEVDVSAGEPRLAEPVRYWAFDAEAVRDRYDFSDPAGQLRELLEDSVRLRLRADVPVGTCLSGGLDSSSIVALASRRLRGPVWTFSAIYPQPEYDESRFVRLMNESFPTVPHEVFPEPERLLDVLPRLVWHQDMPSAGPGLYSQWHVMESAHGQVKVLLDGQGADELLGGYLPYLVDYVRSRGRSALGNPSQLSRLVREARAANQRLGGDLLRQLVLSFLSEPQKRALRTVRGSKHGGEVREEYLAQWQLEGDPFQVEGPFADRLDNALYDALFRRSLPSLLRYEDRNSMAFSIEARTPFLDYRLVEFGLALPFDEKIDGEWTKSVLRRAMDGTLPPEITWRRDKKGYPTPFAVWLKDEFRADAEEIIRSESFRQRGIFDPATVDRLWKEHLEGVKDNSWNVWRWLTLELWYRTFIDGGTKQRIAS